jgi:hypothetical protein
MLLMKSVSGLTAVFLHQVLMGEQKKATRSMLIILKGKGGCCLPQNNLLFIRKINKIFKIEPVEITLVTVSFTRISEVAILAASFFRRAARSAQRVTLLGRPPVCKLLAQIDRDPLSKQSARNG